MQMKRGTLLVALIAAALSTPAAAQTVSYLEAGEPTFSLTYPDGWEVRMPRTAGRNVISAYPTDGSLLWQGMWVMKESTSVEDAIARLEGMQRGLFQDVKLTGDPWSEELGSVEARCFESTGRYQGDQAVESFMALFELPGQRVGAVAYIGDPAGIETHRADLETLLESLEVMP
jgi:hypothetical protein